MTYPFYIVLGLTPSIIWLLFFLRKDSHPEPNKMIIKIFIYGMLSAILAAVIEMSISPYHSDINFPLFSLTSFLRNFEIFKTYPFLLLIIFHLIGIALVEESVKYLVVREKVLKSPEFDEPTDAMLYMIIAGLGFAALENILTLIPSIGQTFFNFSESISIVGFRFIGATFLHALSSGLVGYFLALSLLKTEQKFKLIFTGLIIASLLHGFFNLSIISIVESENINLIIIPIIILTGLALFVSLSFKKLKKTASICR